MLHGRGAFCAESLYAVLSLGNMWSKQGKLTCKMLTAFVIWVYFIQYVSFLSCMQLGNVLIVKEFC